MEKIILIIVNIVNAIHDILSTITNSFGMGLTDKDLHLWVMGILGIFSFFIVHVIFKKLARFSITAISFIYTFTILVVIVFAIEIEQRITGRGQMDLNDALIGLWGFVIFFLIYLALKAFFLLCRKLFKRKK